MLCRLSLCAGEACGRSGGHLDDQSALGGSPEDRLRRAQEHAAAAGAQGPTGPAAREVIDPVAPEPATIETLHHRLGVMEAHLNELLRRIEPASVVENALGAEAHEARVTDEVSTGPDTPAKSGGE